MNLLRLYSVLLLVFFTSCTSGTWTDDPGNFKRIFDFGQPDDVKVLHSYYWKSPHWSTEYQYFIALQPSQKFTAGLTAAQLVTAVTADEKLLDSCGEKRRVFSVTRPTALSSYATSNCEALLD